MKVFVYGTLKRGFGLNGYLSKSKFLGECVINGFDMHTLRHFPAITQGKGKVHGEVYEVDEETLKLLDYIEGVPTLYIREEINTPLGKTQAYTMKSATNYPKIEEGIWI